MRSTRVRQVEPRLDRGGEPRAGGLRLRRKRVLREGHHVLPVGADLDVHNHGHRQWRRLLQPAADDSFDRPEIRRRSLYRGRYLVLGIV